MDKYLEAEKRLAELLGWTNLLIDAEYSKSYGKPPPALAAEWGIPIDGPGRASMPRWCRDNAAAFALIGEHGLRVYADTHPDGCKCVEVDFYEPKHGTYITNFAEHPDRDTAVRYCVVMAVIAKLSTQQEG